MKVDFIENNKKIFLIAGGVAAFLLLGGGALLWAVWQSTPKDMPSANKGSKSTPQYSDKRELVDEVNKKYGTKDFAGAITLIEGQSGSDENVSLQLLLAGAYANSGNIKKAYEIYKKIDDAGKLPKNELANMAAMAERAGETQAAIALYKRAKAYAASTTTISQDEIATYDYKIAELGKKQ